MFVYLAVVGLGWSFHCGDGEHRGNVTAGKSARGRPQKDASNYKALKEKYGAYIEWNELVTILEVIDAVKTRTILLLTTDVRTQRLTDVSRDTIRKH